MPLDSDTLGDLIATIRRYVQERLIPNEGQVADEDRIPPEIVDEMRRLGFFGLTVPEEYGGLGLTMEEEALVGFELGHASPAFRSVFGTNNGIGSQAIVMAGTEEQKQRYLPRLASGELIGSFALTEPEAGSDAAASRPPGRSGTATATFSTAPSGSSPTPRTPACSRSWPAPTSPSRGRRG